MQHIALGRSKYLSVAVAFFGAGFLLGGCGQPGLYEDEPLENAAALEDSDPVDPTEPPTLAVVGGETTDVCGVPMTVKIPGCTATLISPTILLTARHCNPKANMQVQFGEKAPFAFTVRATKCVSATNSDAAYCVLPDDPRLKQVPTVPVLHGCEYTKFLKPGAKVLGVGFGDTRGTGPQRTKLEVEVPVVRVSDRFIDVGDRMHDLCFGDSGGGAFIHLVDGDKDWGWRMIGTVTGTARVPGGAPCGGTNYTTVLRHVKLVEDTEKIDITPCTNAAGEWAPGPECAGFLTNIQTGGGDWPGCTAGARTALAIDSCGMGPAPGTRPPGEGGTTTPPPPGMPPGGPVTMPPTATPPTATPPAPVPPAPVPPAPTPPAPTPPVPPAPTPGETGTTTPPGAAPTAPTTGIPTPPPSGLTPGPPGVTTGPTAPEVADGGLWSCQVGGRSAPPTGALALALFGLVLFRRRRARR
jgi:MYXO-CTERM domain-containing protein